MGKETGISWTDATWNPVRGCSRVSAGCDNCYAMQQAHRFDTASEQSPYHGLTTIRRGKVDWMGHARMVPGMLDAPLRWTKPRRIFVNSMSDLFHESLTNEEILRVFAVMAVCRQHTFQVLTKRPQRARRWFEDVDLFRLGEQMRGLDLPANGRGYPRDCEVWPLPNVWLGASVENQETANQRIPFLLQSPAAVRFVSYEPALGPVDFTELVRFDKGDHHYSALDCDVDSEDDEFGGACLDWVIVGGESGNGARSFDLDWARSVVSQCKVAGVSCFVKQLGAVPLQMNRDEDPHLLESVRLADKKGGDMGEWPESLRVREFPRGVVNKHG